jgi:hypothetical protein|nr:MAG TPA: hypothetical protein [Caudoviricetes sp.]
MHGVALGNLNNGSNAGLSYLNGNNWLSRSWWNNAGRLSGQKICIKTSSILYAFRAAAKIDARTSGLVI